MLTHIIEYGDRCRNMEAQLRAWIALAQSWREDAAQQPEGQCPQSDTARPAKKTAVKDDK